MMFSSVGSVALPDSRNGRHGLSKKRFMPVHDGFSVQLFKAPTVESSFRCPAIAKFDICHASTTSSDSQPRQSWYPSWPVTNENPFSAVRTTSFSIYPSLSSGTFVYERSVSSKSDIYSNSEYETPSTITSTPSSLFSPALSTDSTITLKSPVLAQHVSDTSRSDHPSTPISSSRQPFPEPAQTHSTITDIFLNRTEENSSSHSYTSFIPPAPSIRPSDLPDPDYYTYCRTEAAAAPEGGSNPILLSSSSSRTGYSSAPGRSTSYSTSSSTGFAHIMNSESDNRQSSDDVSHWTTSTSQFDYASATTYQSRATSADSQDVHLAPHVSVTDRHGVPLVSAEPNSVGSRQIYPDYTLQNGPRLELRHTEHPGGDLPRREPASIYGTTLLTNRHAEPAPNPATSYRLPTRSVDDRQISLSDDLIPQVARSDSNTVTEDEQPFIPAPRGTCDSRAYSHGAQNGNQDTVHEFFPFDLESQRTTDLAVHNPAAIPPPSLPDGNSWDQYHHTISSEPLVSSNRNTYDSHNLLPHEQLTGGNTRNAPSISKDSARGWDFLTTGGNTNTIPSVFDSSHPTRSSMEQRTGFAGSGSHSADVGELRNHVGNLMPRENGTSSNHTRQLAALAQHDVKERGQAFHLPPVSEHHGLRTGQEQSASDEIRRATGYYPSFPSRHPEDFQQEPRAGVIPPSQSHSRPASAPLEPNATRASTYPYQTALHSAAAHPERFDVIRSEHERGNYNNDRACDFVEVITQPQAPARALDPASTRTARESPSTMRQSSFPVPPVPEPQNGRFHAAAPAPRRPSSRAEISNTTSASLGSQGQLDPPRPVLSVLELHQNTPDMVDPKNVHAHVHHNSSSPVRNVANRASIQPLGQVASLQGPQNSQQFPRSYVSVSESHRRHSVGDRPTSNATLPHRSVTPFNKTSDSVPKTQGLETQRRYSDGDQDAPQRSVDPRRASTPAAIRRTVRWNENLIIPSPIRSSQRRKGWFNRRGDQLWTNGGVYRPPPTDQQYPIDLEGYPDYGKGWMNEHGVCIDMEHHLIPKPPLRSALKQPRVREQLCELNANVAL